MLYPPLSVLIETSLFYKLGKQYLFFLKMEAGSFPYHKGYELKLELGVSNAFFYMFALCSSEELVSIYL